MHFNLNLIDHQSKRYKVFLNLRFYIPVLNLPFHCIWENPFKWYFWHVPLPFFSRLSSKALQKNSLPYCLFSWHTMTCTNCFHHSFVLCTAFGLKNVPWIFRVLFMIRPYCVCFLTSHGKNLYNISIKYSCLELPLWVLS